MIELIKMLSIILIVIGIPYILTVLVTTHYILKEIKQDTKNQTNRTDYLNSRIDHLHQMSDQLYEMSDHLHQMLVDLLKEKK